MRWGDERRGEARRAEEQSRQCERQKGACARAGLGCTMGWDGIGVRRRRGDRG